MRSPLLELVVRVLRWWERSVDWMAVFAKTLHAAGGCARLPPSLQELCRGRRRTWELCWSRATLRASRAVKATSTSMDGGEVQWCVVAGEDKDVRAKVLPKICPRSTWSAQHIAHYH